MFTLRRGRPVEVHSESELPFAVGRKAPAGPKNQEAYAIYCQEQDTIRLTGYTSLKPPGITKTMQALADEDAERSRNNLEANQVYDGMDGVSLD